MPFYLPAVAATLGILVAKMLLLLFFVGSFKKLADKSSQTYNSDVQLIGWVFAVMFGAYVYHVKYSEMEPLALHSFKLVGVVGTLLLLAGCLWYDSAMKRLGQPKTAEQDALVDASELDLVTSMVYVCPIVLFTAYLDHVKGGTASLLSMMLNTVYLVVGAWGASTLTHARYVYGSRTVLLLTAVGSAACLLF